jgi:hypothetical protein
MTLAEWTQSLKKFTIKSPHTMEIQANALTNLCQMLKERLIDRF